MAEGDEVALRLPLPVQRLRPERFPSYATTLLQPLHCQHLMFVCRMRLPAQGAAAQNRAVEGDEVALRLLPLAQWFELRGAAVGAGPRARGAPAARARAGSAAMEPAPLEAAGGGPRPGEGDRARGGVSALTQGMRALQAGGGGPLGYLPGRGSTGSGAPEGCQAGAWPWPRSPPPALPGSIPEGSLPSRLSLGSCGGAGAMPRATLNPSPNPGMGSSLSGAASAADSVAVRAGSPPPADHYWGSSPAEDPSPNPVNTPDALTCSGPLGASPAGAADMWCSKGELDAGTGESGAWLAAKQATAEAEAPWERARTPAEALSIVAALCAAPAVSARPACFAARENFGVEGQGPVRGCAVHLLCVQPWPWPRGQRKYLLHALHGQAP